MDIHSWDCACLSGVPNPLTLFTASRSNDWRRNRSAIRPQSRPTTHTIKFVSVVARDWYLEKGWWVATADSLLLVSRCVKGMYGQRVKGMESEWTGGKQYGNLSYYLRRAIKLIEHRIPNHAIHFTIQSRFMTASHHRTRHSHLPPSKEATDQSMRWAKEQHEMRKGRIRRNLKLNICSYRAQWIFANLLHGKLALDYVECVKGMGRAFVGSRGW